MGRLSGESDRIYHQRQILIIAVVNIGGSVHQFFLFEQEPKFLIDQGL
jgi:hypothetical protein